MMKKNNLHFINGLGKQLSIKPFVFKWILKIIGLPHLGTRVRLRLLSKAIKKLNLSRDARILDVGCGYGFASLILAKRYSKVIGVDIDGQRLKVAGELAELTNAKLTFTKGNIYNLLFNNSYFDMCICLEVLEHLIDDKRALKELARITKQGGYLIISVPELIHGLASLENLGHVRGGYTLSQFRKIAQKAGYKILFVNKIGKTFWGKLCLDIDFKLAQTSPFLSAILVPILDIIINFEQYFSSNTYLSAGRSVPYSLFAVLVKKS